MAEPTTADPDTPDLPKDPPTDPPPTIPIPAAVSTNVFYIGIALVVAVLALIGVQGDLLGRLIRADPESFSRAMTIVVLGTAAAALLPPVAVCVVWIRSDRRTSAERLTLATAPGPDLATFLTAIAVIVGTVFLAAGVTIALNGGITSQSDRDVPRLTLSADRTSTGDLHIVGEATAISMRLSEHLLFRVAIIRGDDLIIGEEAAACSAVNLQPGVASSSSGDVLYWSENGPDAAGTSKVSADLLIDGADAAFICAQSVLSNRCPNPAEVVATASAMPSESLIRSCSKDDLQRQKKYVPTTMTVIDVRRTATPSASPTATPSDPAAPSAP